VSPDRITAAIDSAWENIKSITPGTRGPVRDAVDEALAGLDSGAFRVAEKVDGKWVTHQWLKKAVLLSFRLNDSVMIPGGPGGSSWYDKVRPKFQGWDEKRFRDAGIRVLPGAQVRYPAYIAPGAVLLPSFVNVGARVESGTMIDTWATVIEDDVFIGARAEVAEGVIVETGSVLSMGVYIGASTRIIDRTTGETHMGRVPAYSVVVSGTQPAKPLPNGEPGPGLYCAVIVKKADAKTRSKTSINELLRD
jgi:2,3,4,5-tetrahydropyridine-2-carboxylate N-succinyltransferase